MDDSSWATTSLNAPISIPSPRPLAPPGDCHHVVGRITERSNLLKKCDLELLQYFLEPLMSDSHPLENQDTSNDLPPTTNFLNIADIDLTGEDFLDQHCVTPSAEDEDENDKEESLLDQGTQHWGMIFNDLRVCQDDKEVVSPQVPPPKIDLTKQQEAQWSKRFKELCGFQKSNGHCVVPHKWTENPALATWVKRQRYQWKLGQQGKRSTLTQDRKDSLDELGFVWNSYDAAWQEKFNELIEFKRECGHTNVPSNYKNHSLSVWVQCQRRRRKLLHGGNSRMKEERVTKLENVGFVWHTRKV